MLRLASAVVADPKVARALDNPALDSGAKESLLLSICGDKLNAEGRSFVRVLIEGDRISLLPQIQAMFESAEGRRGRRGQGDDRDGVSIRGQ